MLMLMSGVVNVGFFGNSKKLMFEVLEPKRAHGCEQHQKTPENVPIVSGPTSCLSRKAWRLRKKVKKFVRK